MVSKQNPTNEENARKRKRTEETSRPSLKNSFIDQFVSPKKREKDESTIKSKSTIDAHRSTPLHSPWKSKRTTHFDTSSQKRRKTLSSHSNQPDVLSSNLIIEFTGDNAEDLLGNLLSVSTTPPPESLLLFILQSLEDMIIKQPESSEDQSFEEELFDLANSSILDEITNKKNNEKKRKHEGKYDEILADIRKNDKVRNEQYDQKGRSHSPWISLFRAFQYCASCISFSSLQRIIIQYYNSDTGNSLQNTSQSTKDNTPNVKGFDRSRFIETFKYREYLLLWSAYLQREKLAYRSYIRKQDSTTKFFHLFELIFKGQKGDMKKLKKILIPTISRKGMESRDAIHIFATLAETLKLEESDIFEDLAPLELNMNYNLLTQVVSEWPHSKTKIQLMRYFICTWIKDTKRATKRHTNTNSYIQEIAFCVNNTFYNLEDLYYLTLFAREIMRIIYHNGHLSFQEQMLMNSAKSFKDIPFQHLFSSILSKIEENDFNPCETLSVDEVKEFVRLTLSECEYMSNAEDLLSTTSSDIYGFDKFLL